MSDGYTMRAREPWETGPREFKVMSGFRVMISGAPIKTEYPGWLCEPVAPNVRSLLANALRMANELVLNHCQRFFRDIGRGQPYQKVRDSTTVHTANIMRRGAAAFASDAEGGMQITIDPLALQDRDFAATLIIHELCHVAGVSGDYIGLPKRNSHYRAYQSEVECVNPNGPIYGGPDVGRNRATFQRKLGRVVSADEVEVAFYDEMAWRRDCGGCRPGSSPSDRHGP